MIPLHPAFLKKDGKDQFVVLPYEEFVAIRELLEDVEDLLELRQAKAQSAAEPRVSLDDLRKKLGLAG